MKGSYYKVQNQAFIWLENQIKHSPEPLEEDFFFYEATKKWPVSEKCIKNRVELMIKLGLVEKFGGVLAWKEGEASRKESLSDYSKKKEQK